MQLIKAYKTEATIQGLTKTVLISIETDHDDFDPTYMEREDVASIEAKMNRGDLDVVWLKVTARFADLAHFEGVDSLGQVFVAKPGDVESTVLDHTMVAIAIEDLVKNVLSGIDEINTFLGKAA